MHCFAEILDKIIGPLKKCQIKKTCKTWGLPNVPFSIISTSYFRLDLWFLTYWMLLVKGVQAVLRENGGIFKDIIIEEKKQVGVSLSWFHKTGKELFMKRLHSFIYK